MPRTDSVHHTLVMGKLTNNFKERKGRNVRVAPISWS
jgi:hypothetical protein